MITYNCAGPLRIIQIPLEDLLDGAGLNRLC